MWKVENFIPLFLVLPGVVGVSPDATVVTSTKEFRDALYDTRVAVIYLQHSLTISAEEWGFVRPDINRRVDIRPIPSGGEFILDLGGSTDLAFVSGPAGELHFHDLQIRGIFQFAISGGSVNALGLFHVNPHQSIHLHNVTGCSPQQICIAYSNDLRPTFSSTESLWSSLGAVNCSIEPQASFDTFMYSDGCVFPQAWDPSIVSGSIHVHNTSSSCAEKCMLSAKQDDIPVVKISTADGRQLLAAIGEMKSKSQKLEIQLLGNVGIYEHQWSGSFWISVERIGTQASIDGLLENGNHAALVFSINAILIQVATGFTLQLTNLVLVMEWFGPGLISKIDWPVALCADDDYFYKWPLFLPYIFALHSSSMRMANVTLVYEMCPSNLDFNTFIASLNEFKADFENREYGLLARGPPAFSISKHAENGVFFDTFSASLPTFLRDGDTFVPNYWNDFQLDNVTVVCSSFGDAVGEIARCFEGKGGSDRSKDEESTSKTDNGISVQFSEVLWPVLVLVLMTV